MFSLGRNKKTIKKKDKKIIFMSIASEHKNRRSSLARRIYEGWFDDFYSIIGKKERTIAMQRHQATATTATRKMLFIFPTVSY